ncbi:reverse transcriptase domain-containing protein [Tanacetum coccineum]
MIDVFNKKITLRVGDDEVIFDVDESVKRPTTEDDECYGINDLDDTINAKAQKLLANEEPVAFLSRGLEKSIDQLDLEGCEPETVKPVEVEREHLYSASANEIDEKKPELKDLLHHLEYAYLHGEKSLPIIISSELFEKEKISLLQVLDKRKGAITWKIPIHVVPKKGGMTVVLNDNNELIPSRTVTGWQVCIDYRKLNDATRKDHFPLPFINQMLKRLYGNEYYCFLDGISGFFQIPIAPEDQEKTTFTCPYGTFAYRRMSFGLCNAPATFQRCMTVIFHDMVEDFMEVFMDNFSVFGDGCLANLDRMLARCEETNLVLLLQGFDIEIKDKRGAENLAADHLLRLENLELSTFTEEEIAGEFPDEHLMALKTEINNDEPWYADYVNYLVGKIVPPNWTSEKRRRFFSQVKNYFWDKPYAFKLCPDNIMRQCVAGNEISKILAHCHSGPTRGHHSASVTGRKVYESRFFWPSIFKDAKDYVMRCDACQRSGNISSRSEMPQNNIQVCDVFDVWGLDFI